MRPAFLAPMLLAASLSVAACGSAISLAEPTAVRGKVTDVAAFDRFIATRPLPSDFRRTYPDVLLVLPNDASTRELRHDNSRYFAELDGGGRIVRGRFQ